MKSDFLLIHKSILPLNYFQVVKARELIEKENISVSLACKMCDISRNTYYKYKDYIFCPKTDAGKKAIISFKTEDNKGVLSNILKAIYSFDGNIITINQESPINNIAYIIITIDVIDLNSNLDDVLSLLKTIDGVKAVNLLAYE